MSAIRRERAPYAKDRFGRAVAAQIILSFVANSAIAAGWIF
jgi:hypothetical protein